jgi:hypothetical protein
MVAACDRGITTFTIALASSDVALPQCGVFVALANNLL